MNRSFWSSKKILITGHTGFKGSWLSLWLQKAGAELTGFALPPPTTPSLFELAQVAEGMVSNSGDIRELDSLIACLASAKPEIVIHLAAQALVQSSYQHPVATYATNIMGTVNLLEAVRQVNSVRVVIIVTSDKCYENKSWQWGYRENDRLGGFDPYASSKACAELVTAAYRQSFFPAAKYSEHGVAMATVRAGNVIGGGDWAANRLVPDIVRAILNGQQLRIRHPQAIRPWQFVLEPLRGYLLLAERLWADGTRFDGAWNFGPLPNDARSVAWVVEQMLRLWDNPPPWTPDNGNHPHEDNYLRLDASRANTLLQWWPRLTLAEALEWTVEWYQAFQKGNDLRQLTENQIERYEQRQ